MNTNNTAVFIGLMTANLFSIQVSAATMSYYMDQSNAIAGEQNYLMVTLADSITSPGALDVTVETLDPLNNVAGANFGIQSFAFNAQPAPLASGDGSSSAGQTLSLTRLADGWSLDTRKNMSEFGKFDIRLSATGGTRTDTLSFTLGGVSHDTVDAYFAAQVADFSMHNETSAFFSAGTPANGENISEVPLPAAAWLFGSGLVGMAGMAGMARRRKTIVSRSQDPLLQSRKTPAAPRYRKGRLIGRAPYGTGKITKNVAGPDHHPVYRDHQDVGLQPQGKSHNDGAPAHQVHRAAAQDQGDPDPN